MVGAYLCEAARNARRAICAQRDRPHLRFVLNASTKKILGKEFARGVQKGLFVQKERPVQSLALLVSTAQLAWDLSGLNQYLAQQVRTLPKLAWIAYQSALRAERGCTVKRLALRDTQVSVMQDTGASPKPRRPRLRKGKIHTPMRRGTPSPAQKSSRIPRLVSRISKIVVAG